MLAEKQLTVDNVFIWFDEKIVSVEAVTKTQNDSLYACDAGDLVESSRTHLRRMKPVGEMVVLRYTYRICPSSGAAVCWNKNRWPDINLMGFAIWSI